MSINTGKSVIDNTGEDLLLFYEGGNWSTGQILPKSFSGSARKRNDESWLCSFQEIAKVATVHPFTLYNLSAT